jgi:hypothetical protein
MINKEERRCASFDNIDIGVHAVDINNISDSEKFKKSYATFKSVENIIKLTDITEVESIAFMVVLRDGKTIVNVCGPSEILRTILNENVIDVINDQKKGEIYD